MNTEWAHMDKSKCPCRGNGWAEVDLDVWKECTIHFEGQLHPQTKRLLLDEPIRMQEEERKSILKFKIREKRSLIQDYQKKVKEEQALILKMELELINKTPTVRAIPAVKVDEIAFPDGDFI